MKPVSPALLRLRPTILPAVQSLVPYYDNGLLLSQHTGERKLVNSKNNDENKETKVEGEGANDKSTLGSYGSLINHGNYETPKKQDRTKGLQDQQNRNYNEQNKYREFYDVKNDKDKPRNEDNNEDDEEDEEDIDEGRESEYIDIRRNKNEDEDQGNDDRYDKYKYDPDSSEEEPRKEQRYPTESYDDEDTPRDKYNYDIGTSHKLIDGSRHDDREDHVDDGEYHGDSYRQQKLARNKLYSGKGRRDDEREDLEDESATVEDELIENQRGRQEKKQYNSDSEHKYQDNPIIFSPPANSHRRAQHKHEEYGETNPKYVREKYQRRQHVKDRYRDPKHENSGNKDHKEELDHGETKEHAHKHEEHHDEKKHGGNHKFEEGKGGEQDEGHHKEDGEKGDKVRSTRRSI